MRLTTHILALSSALLAAAPVMAQANPNTTLPDTISRPATVKTPTPDSAAAAAAAAPSLVPKTVIQHIRVQDQRGINVFETTKSPGVEFTGFKLDFGAAELLCFRFWTCEVNAALKSSLNPVYSTPGSFVVSNTLMPR